MDAEGKVRAILRTEEELIGIYKDAYIKLLERMQYNKINGMDNRHLQALLSDVRSILKTLSSDTRKWIDGNLMDIYQTGADIASNEIAKIGIEASFAKLNRSAIEIMSDDLFNDLATGISNVSRTMQGEIRRMAFQSVQGRMLFGQSTAQATKEMYEAMRLNGLTALRDRAGKRWNLAVYAENIIRTKTREVVTRGTMNTMLTAGQKYNDELLFDLVRISEHKGSCPICIPFQGKVYSLSGKHPHYPKLRKMTPFHPLCRHVTTPFFERLYNGDVDKLRSLSNS